MIEARELTNSERTELRHLVIDWCATWDEHYKHCALTGRDCPMLALTHIGPLWQYFKESVLPNNPRLEATLTYSAVVIKRCAHCGKQFVPSGRQAYCSDYCAQKGKQKSF